MIVTKFPKKNFTVRNNQTTSQLRRIYISRLTAHITASISPIERWPDNNYAPVQLTYVCNQTPETYEIIAPLHEFKAGDVRVDLSRGHVIILLSHEYGQTQIFGKEYYCEIPIPADAKGNEAYIEIGTDSLKIRLDKKSGILRRLRSIAQHLKKALTLPFGQVWNLNSLDE